MPLSRRKTMLTGGLLAGLLLAQAAGAQGAPPLRIRGTIAAVDAHGLTVKERNGASEQIVLDEPVTVTAVRKVALDSIAPGSYIGVTARRTANGSLEALEVHVFPEAMRGAGEGHRPWDLAPDSTMTNGTVDGVVAANAGPELTVTYKDGSQTVHVAPNTPVVTFVPAERADLTAGAPVFFSATRAADGTLHTGRITVGSHGVAPPM